MVMSRILKKLKQPKQFFLLSFIAIEFICFLLGFYIACVIIFVFCIMNLIIVSKMRKECAPFNAMSKIRNVDYLVIGDQCKIKEIVPIGKTYVQIAAPGRSFTSSFEILRHTFSILKDNGGVVVIVGKKKSKEKYTIFDLPYFHQVTLKRLGLQRKRILTYIPIIISPIKSIKILFSFKAKGAMGGVHF